MRIIVREWKTTIRQLDKVNEAVILVLASFRDFPSSISRYENYRSGGIVRTFTFYGVYLI